MRYKRFNRHEHMSSEVRNVIMELLRVPDHKVRNMLYGLFDGYLYNTLYIEFMKMEFNWGYTEELRIKFEKAYSEILEYPTY